MLKRPAAFAAFSVRNYRFQFPADLATSWAFEMESIILGWFVLVETGSVLLLTVFAALAQTGTLIAPILGTIGDRIGHRNLLAMMRSSYAVLASIQMTLVLTGHSSATFVFIIAALTGLVRPSDLGTRGALVASFMPPSQLVGAMSISRTTGDTARFAGALSGAGLVALVGMGQAYIAIVFLYLLSTILTLCVVIPRKPRTADGAEPQLRSPMHDLKEGLVYVWKTPLLQAVMWIAFLVNLTAYPMTNGLLPYIARSVYHTDQTVLGYLSASYACGAFVGSIGLSMISNLRISRLMISMTLVWYVLLLWFAHVQTVPVAIACLIAAGFFQSLSLISISVILLRTASERLRGRVMGARMLAIYGLPVGLLGAGALISQIGYVWTATIYPLVGLAAMAFILVRWHAELWRADAPANAV